ASREQDGEQGDMRGPTHRTSEGRVHSRSFMRNRVGHAPINIASLSFMRNTVGHAPIINSACASNAVTLGPRHAYNLLAPPGSVVLRSAAIHVTGPALEVEAAVAVRFGANEIERDVGRPGGDGRLQSRPQRLERRGAILGQLADERESIRARDGVE